MKDDVRWPQPGDPRPPYCYWCTMDGHTYFDCPERQPLEAATAHYGRRSAAFYRLLTEGLPDPLDGDLTPQERTEAEAAHAALGKAMEGEVFGDRKPREGTAPDDVQTPGEPS